MSHNRTPENQYPALLPQHNTLLGDVHQDADLISAFLGQQKSSGEAKFSINTRQSYEKELRRLVLFCQEINVCLPHVTLTQVNRFLEWLKHPPAQYIAHSRRSYRDPEWRLEWTPPRRIG